MYLLCMSMHSRYACAVQYMCGGQETAHRDRYSLVLGMELRLSGSASGAFPH